MNSEHDIECYYTTVVREGLYSNRGNLKYHMESLFGALDLKQKRVLDIGGGAGLYSFYLAMKGAQEVVCLEPEAEGSTSGITDRFRRLQEQLGCNTVELKPLTLQAWQPEGKTFDLILLHDSVNHLNEPACINLRKDPGARAIYRAVFTKIYQLSDCRSKLVVCDCSRNNFFALLGVRNPLTPTIEWHKHQAPQVWARLFSEVGYTNPNVSWLAFNSLRRLGKVFLGNQLAAYFLTSHFCLTMDKPAQPAAVHAALASREVGSAASRAPSRRPPQ